MREEAVTLDDIVASIYRAGGGLESWTEPLQRVATMLDLWVVQFFGVNKQLGTVLFSFEGGRSSPETAFDWFHKYHRIDPRAALVARSGVKEWIACDEHFDEAYVAASPFYQEFLLPYGGRYVYGAKLLEDETSFVVIAFHRGRNHPQLSEAERDRARVIARHFVEAFRLQASIAAANKTQALGLAVLDKMRQPIIVLDANRKITYSNSAGQDLLSTGNDLLCDRGGYATCRDENSDIELMFSLREVVSGAADRRGLRFRKPKGGIVAATMLPLQPDRVMGAFGHLPMVLLTVYDPGSGKEMDPFLLQATFDLTPAEARVAVRLASGLAVKAIATELAVSPSTVRSQLKTIFLKTGAHRQADLVRVLMLATEF